MRFFKIVFSSFWWYIFIRLLICFIFVTLLVKTLKYFIYNKEQVSTRVIEKQQTNLSSAQCNDNWRPLYNIAGTVDGNKQIIRMSGLVPFGINNGTVFQDGNCVQYHYIRVCPAPENPDLEVILLNDNESVSFELNGIISYSYVNNIIGSKGDYNLDAACLSEDYKQFIPCFKGPSSNTTDSCRFPFDYNCDIKVDLFDLFKFQNAFGSGNFLGS